MLNMRLREVIRQAVVGQAELQSGRLPGAQNVTVGFVDIVGFTELGEQVQPEELGTVVRSFERTVEEAALAPVRLVKTIGDAAMLVAPEAGPVLDAVLGLVEGSREDDERPLLRGGPDLRRGAAARRRPLRATGQPGRPPDRLRPARQRGGLEGGPRRRGGRVRVVAHRQAPLQGRERRGGGVSRAPGRERLRRAGL